MIALRTRTLTDEALLGHASSHGHRMHMDQGRNGNSSRYLGVYIRFHRLLPPEATTTYTPNTG